MTGAPAPLAPGTRVAGLRIVRATGTTPRGQRYLAETDRGERRDLTVFALAPDDPTAFRREVSALSTLRVPGVVSVLDGDPGSGSDGVAHLVEDHVRGTALSDVLADGPLGAAAIDILDPLARSLDALHDRGLVHRDLTPAAVVVDQDGPVHLRLTVDRLFPDSGTATGDITEVAVRQAPEVAASGTVSHRSDLFAFGCVAFEAMTGTPAFTLSDVLSGSYAPPSAAQRRPGLPTGVDSVFEEALATHPVDRFPSARAMVDALRDALGARYRPRAGRALRRLVWISGIAAVLAVLAAGAALLLV